MRVSIGSQANRHADETHCGLEKHVLDVDIGLPNLFDILPVITKTSSPTMDWIPGPGPLFADK